MVAPEVIEGQLYIDAADCAHPEPPEDSDAWSDWDEAHQPHATLGRICLLTPAEDDPKKLRVEIERPRAMEWRVRKFAQDMRTWCSPHGVAADYADRLEVVLDAQESR